MTIELSPHFARILAAPVFGHLATVRPHGGVQVNPMWFEFDGEAGVIRFTHTTKRAKFKNLQKNPHMTLEALDPENPHKYVEVRGRLAEVIHDPEGSFYVHLGQRYGNPHQQAPADKDDRVILATRKGKGISFKASDARPMGRSTQGVTGIRLKKGDEVVGMGIARQRTEVLSVTENGYGKRTSVDEFPTQGRGGQGVILASLGPKTGDVAAMQMVDEGSQEILLISTTGVVIRTPLDQIRVLGRPTMGVKVMTTGDAKIASIATFTTTRPTQTQLPVK